MSEIISIQLLRESLLNIQMNTLKCKSVN